jgi:NAD(P)-dependent dehydrogenase (short-subunit alcohol dehydrogenase family)
MNFMEKRVNEMGILDKFSLNEKIALVTGGRGLYGRQIVEALAEAGATVYTASRSFSDQQLFADMLAERGLDVRAAELDQGNEASALRLRDRILDECGRVDVLVNNAVVRPMRSWQDDISAFAESMHVNATGIFMVTRAFGDAMAKRGCGSIVNIGSIQGMVGGDSTLYEGLPMNGMIPDYFFHKGGLINFTRFTASYYGPNGVRCNCLSPGGFYTDKTNEVFNQRYSGRTFLGRMAGETDLMGAVVFLASDASAYVTGVNLPVDGGYTAK